MNRSRTFSNLSTDKKDFRALTSRRNLIKHGFLSDQVESLVQYKKFHKGRIIRPKISEEGADYWSDSENEESIDEDLNDVNNSQVVEGEGTLYLTFCYSIHAHSLINHDFFRVCYEHCLVFIHTLRNSFSMFIQHVLTYVFSLSYFRNDKTSKGFCLESI